MECPVHLLCFIKSSENDIRVEGYNFDLDVTCGHGPVPTLKNVGNKTVEISSVRISDKELQEKASIPPGSFHKFDFSEVTGIGGDSGDTIVFKGNGFEISGTIVERSGVSECPSYFEYITGGYWNIGILALVVIFVASVTFLLKHRRKNKD